MAASKKNKLGVKDAIYEVLERAKENEITQQDIQKCIDQLIADLSVKHHSYRPNKNLLNYHRMKSILWLVIYRLLPLCLLLVTILHKTYLIYSSEPCLVMQPILHDFATPIVNCTRCCHIKGPLVIEDIHPKEFMEKHAFTLQPLLMKGAASNWSAMQVFSYNYFKSLYTKRPDSVSHDVSEGQFFPYSSGIHRLDEFLALDNETAALQGKRWYIGWSTTEPFIGEELRKHLRPPYFLPPKSSDVHLAWIFMGAPGPGASLHVDWVGRPSWQAQLSGKKTWTLAPPTECEGVCSMLNVTVERGDIIVIDTNAWFHATYIHPGNISITYGAEYE